LAGDHSPTGNQVHNEVLACKRFTLIGHVLRRCHSKAMSLHEFFCAMKDFLVLELRKISNVLAHPRPMRYAFGKLLVRSELCRLLVIDRGSYKVRFFPSSVSLGCFLDQNAYRDDEGFLELYLRDGDRVIDVGANVGLITLAAASLVGQNGLVLSIEPQAKIFQFLAANVALNEYHNVVLSNVAVGEKNARVGFLDSREDDSTSHLVRSGNPVITMYMFPLKDVLLGVNGIIHLLKIDVEGYEKFVIEGTLEVLPLVECIYFECFEENFRRYSYAPRDIIRLLQKNGFSTCHWDGTTLRRVGPDHTCTVCQNLIAHRNPQMLLTRLNARGQAHKGNPLHDSE
jgi:FkbM family methyltransferase